MNKVEFEFPPTVELSKNMQKAFQKKMGYFARIRSKIETVLGI
jgi:hypothetical protein